VPLDQRSIAFDGIGDHQRVLARDGLWPDDEEPPVDPNLVVMPFVPRRVRTRRRRHDEETILFLMRR
jgi:hypothetical protein